MSLSELREKDIPRNVSLAKALALKGEMPLGVAEYFANTVWPFIAGMLEETEELDAAVDDLIGESDDMLQPETAAKLSAALMLGHEFAAELRRRMAITADPGDTVLKAKLAAFDAAFAESVQIINDVVIADEGELEGTDDDEGDDDEDDEDDDDAEDE